MYRCRKRKKATRSTTTKTDVSNPVVMQQEFTTVPNAAYGAVNTSTVVYGVINVPTIVYGVVNTPVYDTTADDISANEKN